MEESLLFFGFVLGISYFEQENVRFSSAWALFLVRSISFFEEKQQKRDSSDVKSLVKGFRLGRKFLSKTF